MFSLSRILVPVDFSQNSGDALRYAVFLAERFDASIDVLHVWVPPPHVRPELLTPLLSSEERKGETQARLHTQEEMQGFLLSLGLDEHPRIRPRYDTGKPAETIVSNTAERAYDLIVMGTHGRTGLSRVMLGSVAEYVVRHATCPVLTIRPFAAAIVKLSNQQHETDPGD